MSGKTQDSMDLQADHLPTGSISFGRFEVESLSWERRSKFSHNRYLEEVEKYSTPGSVTQKRAILEAHFKKKPLLQQTSLEHQDESEYQDTPNHIDQQTSCFEELVDHDNEEHSDYAWYDDTPDVSDENEMEGKQEEETSPLECTSCSDEKVLHPTEPLDLDQTIQPQPEHLIQASNKELCVVVEPEPDNKAVIVEELLEKRKDIIVEIHKNRDISSRSFTIERNNGHSLKKTLKASVKVNEVMKPKTGKIRTQLPAQLPVQQNLRNSPIKSSGTSVTKLSQPVEKAERENTLRRKLMKQSPSRAPTSTSVGSKNPKIEPSQSLTAKVRKEQRSTKAVQAKKGGIAAYSVSGKSEMDISQTVNRPKEVVDSTKEEIKQTGRLFSFKCEERAERRKEYYTKLEEKLHAKEAEMNEIQARTQEETEAKLKQFRRSLSFKATPMPSFYREAVPKISEAKKKLATPNKPQKLQSKSTSPGSRSNIQRFPAVSKFANREKQADESISAIQTTQKLEAGNKERESIKKKAESVNRMRRKVVQSVMVSGSVAVHVAS